MGYRIQYNPDQNVHITGKKFVHRLALATAFFIGVGIWFVCPEITVTIRKILFPGDLAVTAAALEELTCDLRSGVEVVECLHNFCRHILEGAGFDILG